MPFHSNTFLVNRQPFYADNQWQKLSPTASSTAPRGLPQTVRMNRWCPQKNKRDSHRTTASFGEGILLLMGCSQNYIMYWGLQVLLYTNASKSLPKHFFILKILLCKTESGVF
jgi:hypothetical protein